MNVTKSENTSGLLVAIDFQMVFDSINWKFLENVLQSFGFGQSFIQWVKTFYCDVISCVMNNAIPVIIFKFKKESDKESPFLPIYLFLLLRF